jgi:hypothetical protein
MGGNLGMSRLIVMTQKKMHLVIWMCDKTMATCDTRISQLDKDNGSSSKHIVNLQFL